ncbi:MAG: hypothetical protein U5K55_00795 [Aliarcobacter sp.]|nr:hypothetical protein [Aliarcobacter sp.]
MWNKARIKDISVTFAIKQKQNFSRGKIMKIFVIVMLWLSQQELPDEQGMSRDDLLNINAQQGINNK